MGSSSKKFLGLRIFFYMTVAKPLATVAKLQGRMNFIKYKDELINLDLVASINKDHFRYEETKTAYTIIFEGAFVDKVIGCLKFDNKEIRDKVFNDICYNIEFNFRSTFIEIKNEQ